MATIIKVQKHENDDETKDSAVTSITSNSSGTKRKFHQLVCQDGTGNNGVDGGNGNESILKQGLLHEPLSISEANYIMECIDNQGDEQQHDGIVDDDGKHRSITIDMTATDNANPTLTLPFLNSQYVLYKLKIIVLISSVFTNILLERCIQKCDIDNCHEIINAIWMCLKIPALKSAIISVHKSLKKMFYRWHGIVTSLIHNVCHDTTLYNLFVVVNNFGLKQHIQYLENKKLKASKRQMEVIYHLMKPIIDQVKCEITEIYTFEIPIEVKLHCREH